MTATENIRLFLLICSAGALLIRSPSVLSARSRPMWFALLALTTELLLLQNPVIEAVARSTDSRYLAAFVGGFCHMFMTIFIWFIAANATPGPRRGRNVWRWWFIGVTLSVIFVNEAMFVVETRGDPTRSLTSGTGLRELIIAWTGYLLFITVASTDTMIRLWGHVRTTTFPAIRFALGILCLGTVASLVYVVARTISLLAGSARAAEVVLLASAVYFLCFSIGCVTALASPLIEAVIAWWHRRRLYRLWRSITSAVPDVVLEQCSSYWTDVFRVRRNKVRLHRRVVEIQDAALTLNEWVTPEQVAAFTAEADMRGLTGDVAAATVTARCLEAARLAKLAGRDRSTTAADMSRNDADIDAELRWLVLVSRAYRTAGVAVRADGA